MTHRTANAITALALVGGIYVGSTLGTAAKPAPELTPVRAAAPIEVTVDKQAVINALNTRAQIVGLTGKVAKTVTLNDSAWYGDKTYELAATGTFKLGVDTDDITVITRGNTVTVRFPQPKVISVDMPFDKAALKKDVGLLRKDLTEAELQAMYGKARESAVADIKRDRQAFDKAEESIERTIEKLLAPIPGVEDVETGKSSLVVALSTQHHRLQEIPDERCGIGDVGPHRGAPEGELLEDQAVAGEARE